MARKRLPASRKPAESRLQDQILAHTSLNWTDLAVGAAVAAAAAVLYCLTAARDFVLGDTPELMTAAITLGVPHPPGYPLFTMLGHLFSLWPGGAVPFRVNLLAAACGTGTVALVYLTALRVCGSRTAPACAALVLACSPLFWKWSLVAEVFPLNNLLAAATIYALVVWYERPERMGFLAAGAFFSGLALANQQTIVLLGPAVVFVLWRRRDALRIGGWQTKASAPLRGGWRMKAAAPLAFLLGLLPYAYLPWAAARRPLWNWGDASSAANLIAVMTRQHFGSGQLINSPKYQGGSPADRIVALGASFGLLAGLLVVAGAIQAWRRARWYFWFSALAFAFAGPIFAAYANMDLAVPLSRYVLERFYLLPQVVLAPLMAFGVMLAAELVPRAKWLAPAAVLLAVAGGVAANYREIDQSRNHVARRFAEDIFATLAPGSILAVDGDEVIMPLAYLQDVEGYRRDVALVIMPLLHTDWYVEQVRRQFPNLVVPFARYGGRIGTARMLIEANRGRPFAVDGFNGDDSLKQDYWFYRRGLVDEIEPMSRDVKLDEMIADNQRLFDRYRLPSPNDIKRSSLEPTILTHYATPAAVAGQQCQQFHYDAQAREWYQRALALDPSLSQVRQWLASLPQ